MIIPLQFQGNEKIRAIKDLDLFKGAPITDKDLEDLAKQIEIKCFLKDETIIKQNDFGDKIYFIFQGSVRIIVNGKTVVGERKAGEHVGEIASVFTKIKRTATVQTQEESILGEMSGVNLTQFLEKYPILYQDIAFVLAKRLEQRNCLVRSSQQKPVVFIGSSTEGLEKLEGIVKQLEALECVIKRWDSDVFKPSQTTIENLEKMLDESDFGIIVLTPDDHIKKRGKNCVAPRDNLIFELGLLMGNLSRKRTLFIMSDTNIELPSDLKSIRHLSTNSIDEIIKHIQLHGCR